MTNLKYDEREEVKKLLVLATLAGRLMLKSVLKLIGLKIQLLEFVNLERIFNM